MEKPERAYTINIKVSADDWEACIAELNFIVDHVIEHGEICSSVSGGYSTGHIVNIEHDPEMTHEKYFELSKQWMNETRKPANIACTPTKGTAPLNEDGSENEPDTVKRAGSRPALRG